MPRRHVQSQRPRKKQRQQAVAVSRRAGEPRPDTLDTDGTLSQGQGTPTQPARPAARPRPYQARAATTRTSVTARRSLTLSREQEYAFIREDLKRLLITAGALVVVMVVLLMVIDR